MNVAIVLQGLATVSWLVLIGLLVITVTQASRGRNYRGTVAAVIVALVLGLLLSTASAGMVFIQPDERGVVISAVAPKGYREVALQPGLRWIIPFFESVVRYPISRQTYTMSIATQEGQIQGDDSITARTSDGQEIYIDASIIYALDPNEVIGVHIAWQNRYSNDLVRPLARGVIRDAVSQYRVEEVVTSQRFALSEIVRASLSAKLDENGLVLVDFVLRNITFSPEYAASVEQKQIAEQQAQQAKLVVESKKQEAEQVRQTAQGAADAAVIRAKGDADARLIQAEAEAEALRLLNETLKQNPDLITYLYVTKLAPNVQVIYLPTGQQYLIPLPTPAGEMTPSGGLPSAQP